MTAALVAIAVGCFLAVGVWLGARRAAARRASDEREACTEFRQRLAELEPLFLAAANATGRPRGLRWVECRLQPDIAFARDRATGELHAFAAATIRFEALAGGGMEEVEAVGNARAGSAVFAHRAGRWASDGRTVFNLGPEAAVAHFARELLPVANDH